MICLGVLLLIAGLVARVAVLEHVGAVVLVIGLLLLGLAYAGRPVGNRNWW